MRTTISVSLDLDLIGKIKNIARKEKKKISAVISEILTKELG